MTTLYLDWNQDFLLTPSGSLQLAVGWDEVRQRIIRRLITVAAQTLPDGTITPPNYIFHPTYGVGLAILVDQDFGEVYLGQLTQRIQSAVLQDVAVSSTIPPSIKVIQSSTNTVWIVIGVTLVTGQYGEIALMAT
jgi:hypothetical protein